MNYYIKQSSIKNCGRACTKMMLAYYQRNERFLDLDSSINNNNFALMKDEMKKYQVEVEGIEITDQDYLDQINFAISQIKYQNTYHFVIFIKKKKNTIYLYDPLIGKRKLKLEEYLLLSTGKYLIYKSHEKYLLEDELLPPSYTNIPYLLTYMISCLLDFLFIYMFTYMNTSVLKVSLMMLGIISNFILKLIVINAFDKHLEVKLIEPILEETCSKKQLENRVKLKSSIIEYYFKSIAFIFILMFLLVLLISDSIYNLSLIILSLVFVLLKESLLERSNQNIKEKIMKEENDNLEINKDNYKKMKKISFRMVINIVAFYMIFIIFNVFMGLFICYIENQPSFTHFIFVLLTNISFFEFIIKILQINQRSSELIHQEKSLINSYKSKKKS